MNIETGQQVCEQKCSRTFRGEHGSALPGGPFPSTHGAPGDVRRCEHSRIWLWLDDSHGIDRWTRLSLVADPVTYLTAARHLRNTPPSPSPERKTQ